MRCFREAATLLDNGLALDGLDEQDTAAVVAGLCDDLVAEDPVPRSAPLGGRVGARGDLHDPAAVSAAYLASASILQLLRTDDGPGEGRVPRAGRPPRGAVAWRDRSSTR